MITSLYIRNFTLIEELNIDFRPGFSVITGETGAGKSIILGALSLLLGNRADIRNIKAGREKCVVEGHFDISQYSLQEFFTQNDIDYESPHDCILRREISINGKSRAFVNDCPVALSTIRTLGERLIDIHSQHQNLLLGKEDFQLNVIDTLANDNQLLAQYQHSFSLFKAAEVRLDQLKEEFEHSKSNEDFLQFQFNELTEAALSDGEQAALEAESATLTHSEEIKSALYSADSLLNGDEYNVVRNLRTASSSLRSIEKVLPEISELADRLDSCQIELKDISADVCMKLDHVDFNPRRLEQINERLDLLYTLERKYRVNDEKGLIETFENIKNQLSAVANGDEQLAEQEALVGKLHQECLLLANRLTSIRTKTAEKVQQEMRSRLAPLGIPNVHFEVGIEQRELGYRGADKVTFLFSANNEMPLRHISDVASGGEIARVMLSIKAMISGVTMMPTIIFDEIDTGVSGRIAEKMAEIMQEMSRHGHQVVSITHQPQIAAIGTSHYKVSKEESNAGTNSSMKLLTHEERVQEIAQMLSGSDVTTAAVENAKSLLNRSK